ncbi:unnamed protein product [Medioppia subpectinata]|uniref:CWH43-like N-terminal domain-containing protein n=1 Tax=Medioppia subpectinata TaxID=1979941 RepID=A0A7R9KHC2_9ACAR|nr:unnamed protein product [Medioppia subpectinata]CAG2103384.1 unnamed protein product [Medioppia subpectinata]
MPGKPQLPGVGAYPDIRGRGINYGCSNSFCWARCTGLGLGFFQNEWCYTTEGYSLDFRYVSCKDDDQCKPDWSCAGFCTIWTIATCMGHIQPYLPYVSDLGVIAPEAALFSLFMNIGAILITTFAYIRYQCNKTYSQTNKALPPEHREAIVRLNRRSLCAGLCMATGFAIVGNFRNAEGVVIQSVHNVGAVTGFVGTVTDMACQSLVARRMAMGRVARLRAWLATGALLLAVTYNALSILSFVLLPDALQDVNTRLMWASSQPGYIPHVMSTTLEWVLIFMICPYILSFVDQFKQWGLALWQGHIYPFLPYVSDIGVLPPEASLFGVIMNLGAIMIIAFTIIRYESTKTYIHLHHPTLDDNISDNNNNNDYENELKIVNKRSLRSGLCIAGGFVMVGNFRAAETTLVLAVHSVGASFAFISLVCDMCYQRTAALEMGNGRAARVRKWLAILSVILLVSCVGCALWSGALYPAAAHTESRLLWDTRRPGFVPHVISTTLEWLLIFLLCPYFLTFVREFREYSLSSHLVSLKPMPDSTML